MEKSLNYKKGEVIVITFHFSDSSEYKKRPALIIATFNDDNIVACQITSQTRPDPDTIKLTKKDFQSGNLSVDSFIRPSMIFTLNKSKIEYVAGKINISKTKEVEKKLIDIFTRL